MMPGRRLHAPLKLRRVTRLKEIYGLRKGVIFRAVSLREM